MKTLPDSDRLLWQCRRGMLELDFVLHDFVTNSYDALANEEKRAFLNLLDEPDQLIFDWLVDKKTPENRDYLDLMNKLKGKNK